MPYGRIPGVFGNGFEAAPDEPFTTPSNPLQDISPTSAATDIPGTYEDGAANDQGGRSNNMPVGYFGASNSQYGGEASGGAGEVPDSTPAKGVCLNGWGYMGEK